MSSQADIIEAKRKLYSLLLHKKPVDLSNAEINIAYELSRDPDIQAIINGKEIGSIVTKTLWEEFYIVFNEKTQMGLCGLCNNSGKVQLRATSADTGEMRQDVRPCLCPNGRSIKKAHDGL